MRVVGYARVSSREQAETSHALEQQIERLKAAGATQIYHDVQSGSDDNRPAFKELMHLVERGQVNQVIFTRLDRMSRTLKTALDTIEKFAKSGVELKVLDDNIDTTSSVGRLQTNVLATLSQFEVDRLSERVKHGWQHLRDKKIAMNPCFGYRKVDDKFELDDSEFLCLLETKTTMTKAQIARDIIDIFLEKRSLRATIQQINTKYGIQRYNYNKGGGFIVRGTFRWSPSGLTEWLKNPTLRGNTAYLKKKNGKRQDKDKWDLTFDTHPDHKLLNEQESIKIQDILSSNKRERNFSETKRRHCISGLVYCSECRSSCYSQTGTRGKTPGYNHYFQCKNSVLKACSNKKMIRVEKIESSLIKVLLDYRSGQVVQVKDVDKNIDEQITKLQQQLEILELAGDNPAIEQAKRQIKNQINVLENRAQLIDSEKLEADEFLQRLDELGTIEDGSLFKLEHTNILHKLVKEIWVLNGAVERIVLNV